MTRRKTHPLAFPNAMVFSSQESQGTPASSSFSTSDQSQTDPVSSQTSYVRTQPSTNQVENAVLRELVKEKNAPTDTAAEPSRPSFQTNDTSKVAIAGLDRSHVAGKAIPADFRALLTRTRRTSATFDAHYVREASTSYPCSKPHVSV